MIESLHGDASRGIESSSRVEHRSGGEKTGAGGLCVKGSQLPPRALYVSRKFSMTETFCGDARWISTGVDGKICFTIA